MSNTTKAQHTLNLSTAMASDADIRAAAGAQKRRILENAGYFEMADALRTLVDLETKQHRPEVAAKAFAAARAALAKAAL